MIQNGTACAETQHPEEFASALESARPGDRPRLSLDADDTGKGLGKLVLTLLELLRQLLERQALRRVDGGGLTEAEIERLGRALMQLADQMQQLKKELGLEDEDLNLDLGPLGRLL